MGLTIHYQLSTRRKLDSAAVRALAEKLRAAAVKLGAASVSEVFAVLPDLTVTYYAPRRARRISDLVPPQEGWLFGVNPGDGCEGVRLGLCRFEGVRGWRLDSFCKTQYAARHGWEHFRDCHRMVIELLWTAEDLGLKAKVHDEGGLWETGSEARLRRRLAEYDRGIAAFGGALKDAANRCSERIRGPIFDDPRFERLEAEGMAESGDKITAAVEIAKRFARSPRG